MKIYNEIVWKWNEHTQKMEEVYSDSFEYDGPLDKLQGYGSGGSGGSGGGSGGGAGAGSGGSNQNTTQNTDDEYGLLWENENMQQYKEALSERISYLVLSRLGEIENALGIDGIENIQKTFRDGQLVSGRNNSEVMVVYEFDNDANKDKGHVLDSIVNWANFLHPSLIGLNITTNSTIGDGGEETSYIILELTAPNNGAALNINSLISELDLSNVSLKDNVSQFYKIEKTKTVIDKSKLSDFVDVEFSEITPQTFTHKIEKYQAAKNELPFFGYRSEDFFDEWNVQSENLPISYRIKKFFEEFEKIKEDIQPGSFGYKAVTITAEGTGYYKFDGDFITSPRTPRRLLITDKDGNERLIYSTNGRGHRITVFEESSFVNGNWNGTFKYDKLYDTYGGRTLDSSNPYYNTKIGGDTECNNLADHIMDGFPDGTMLEPSDLVVITSFDAVRYTSKLRNALKSIGARDPKVIPPENYVDVVSSELRPNILAEYLFFVPNDGTQTVNPGIYTSAAQVTKFGDVILNNNGILNHTLGLQPGAPDGEGSNGLNELVEAPCPPTARFSDSAIRQTRVSRDTEYEITTFGLKPETEYTLELWVGAGSRHSNSVLLTSNGLSRQCEAYPGTDSCGDWDYSGSPTQDLIAYQLGGFERAAGNWVFEHPSSEIVTPEWWSTNYPEVIPFLQDGVDRIGTITLGNVFYTETNYGNKHSPFGRTYDVNEVTQLGSLIEFYTLHDNQEDSARFIAEIVYTGAPFHADDLGLFKIVYCYENGCPEIDLGYGHNYHMRMKYLGNKNTLVDNFPDMSDFKPFHARAYTGTMSNNETNQPAASRIEMDEAHGIVVETVDVANENSIGVFTEPVIRWEKRTKTITTPPTIDDGLSSSDQILQWYVGYGNGTECDRIEIQSNLNTLTWGPPGSGNVDCDYVLGSTGISQDVNYRVVCDNGTIIPLHYGNSVGETFVTSDGLYGPNDDNYNDNWKDNLLFQTSFGVTNGLDNGSWFINHYGDYGGTTGGESNPTQLEWWDNLPEVRDVLLAGPYGANNFGQVALGNLLMFETNINANFDYINGTYGGELVADVEWHQMGVELELYNDNLHFIVKKIYDGSPFGLDNNGIWEVIHCYDGGCPGQRVQGGSTGHLSVNMVLPLGTIPDSYPIGTGLTPNQACQNSTTTNDRVYYTDFKIYETNPEDVFDGYYNNTDDGQYTATKYLDRSGKGNHLRLLSNSVHWLFTLERGWTLFFTGAGNERIQDITTLNTTENSDGGFDYNTNFDIYDSTRSELSNPGNKLTMMFDIYLTEYDTIRGSNQIILNKESQYEVALCNSGRGPDQYGGCEPGEILWAIRLDGVGWYWTGTNYIVPLNQWTHIAITYDGVEGVKTYADGELVSTATHCPTSAKSYAAPDDPNFEQGVCDYTKGTNIKPYGTTFSIGARSLNKTDRFSHNLRNASLDRVTVANKALTQEQIRVVGASLLSELGDNVQRTPYALIGSPQFEEGDGIEVITEASPEADLAIAQKLWPPNAEYTSWESDTAGYLISELQQFSNEEVPIYTSNQVRQLRQEVDTLNEKLDDQSNMINDKNLQINTLEEQLQQNGTSLDYYGDCSSVTGGYTCEDTIISHDNYVNVTCTDGTVLQLYCNPDSTYSNCNGKPEFPFAGPISGQEACEGT